MKWFFFQNIKDKVSITCNEASLEHLKMQLYIMHYSRAYRRLIAVCQPEITNLGCLVQIGKTWKIFS